MGCVNFSRERLYVRPNLPSDFSWIPVDISVAQDVTVQRFVGSKGGCEVDSPVFSKTLISFGSLHTNCGAVNTGQAVSLRRRRS